MQVRAAQAKVRAMIGQWKRKVGLVELSTETEREVEMRRQAGTSRGRRGTRTTQSWEPYVLGILR